MNNNLEATYEVTLNGEMISVSKSLILTKGLTALGITLDEPANFFDYATLTETWSSSSAIPTEAEIISRGEQGIIEEQAEYDANAYARSRKAAYDALNQLELISDDAINGTTTHADAILAIKAEFPKP